MLIKRADDKSEHLKLLESLQGSPKLDFKQKKWAREELVRVRRGLQGERDAAHYLDNYLADSRNYALIHDLRLEFADETAQIDHLVISRTFDFYLLETKNFNGDLRINELGEFSVKYAGEAEFGIPSPLEQSRRHERVLRKALDSCGISGRISKKPNFIHVVLVSPKSKISRPSAEALDTSMIIKADQFRTWHEKLVDRDEGIASAVTGLLNVRSSETVMAWGENLAQLHRPTGPLPLPEHVSAKLHRGESVSSTGGSTCDNRPHAARHARDTGKEPKRLVCATCGTKIGFPEARFCWNNEARFGGQQYCREHQAAFK